MVFVTEDDQGERLGCATLGHTTHFTGERQAYINELATSEVAEGRGVGTALIAACEHWAREQGYRILALSTGAANERALGFYHHLGIPSGGIGFDGPDGIYHSAYDSYDWMSRFGDPGYTAHRVGAQLVALIMARLANNELLPLDYAFFGTEMSGLVNQLDSGITKKQWGSTVSTQTLKDALDRFTAVAKAFGAARDSASSRAAGIDSARAQRVNRALMQVERRLTRPQGLVSRPWFRSLQFASDLDNGYATMAFPSVNEAIRYGDAAKANAELADLVSRVDQARAALVEAAAALR